MQTIDTINFHGMTLDVYGDTDNPLFLAVDVARIIEYSDGNTDRMLDTIDDNEKLLLNTRTNGRSNRGNPKKWFLTEEGLYEVLFQSRKPIARKFKTVVKRALRDIRRGKGYSMGQWFGRFDGVDDLDGFNVLREDFGLPPVTDEEAFGRSYHLEREYMAKQ